MSVAAAEPFDVCGPLPGGVTVLEASAGTGKTYAIASLAARYVAEGTPLERLLLVTFTRSATSELRERVRERLLAVERGLAGGAGADELVTLLAAGAPEVVAQRHARLRRALASFDAATIATTHGFCQEVLDGLGVAGDVDPDAVFVEDPRELIEEVIDDLYVLRSDLAGLPAFDRGEAAKIVHAAVANPAAPLAPAQGGVPESRRKLAEAARREFDTRKRRTGIMTFEDLLTRLRDTLTAPGGAEAAARVSARFDVVLVDEFQDTDPVQWEILRRAFAERGTALILIGDPKQAIYAFRGADVYAYLQAAASAPRPTLTVNWRSDQGLIDAYDALFGGAKLGHEGIVYRPVRAIEANRAQRLIGAPQSAPLRIRVLERDSPSVALTPTGWIKKPEAREHIVADVAADIVALLSSAARIEPAGEPVGPGHVAVLVPTNRLAADVRDALEAASVPAVINGAGSVFATRPAGEWLRLLEAIERPTSATRARSAALTCFLGWPAERVAAADDADWEEVHRRLHEWARVLRTRGVASLTETVTLSERLPERLLALSDGERRLTDLRHVAQLLQAAATTEKIGTTALTAWLRRRIAEADHDTSDEERSRRLESDAEAVQVLTIHRSKGLEFEVVYAPFLWDPGWVPRDPEPVCFHDPDAGDERTVDVALQGPGYTRHARRALEEERGEALRLAYVALTRAKHQAVVWWAGSWDSRDAPLTRLLFSRDAEGNVAPAGSRTPDDAEALARFEALATAAPGCVSVERSRLGAPTAWASPPGDAVQLSAASFDRALDRGWRRTSFSDLSAGAYEARVASEPEPDAAAVTDEPQTAAAPVPAQSPPGESPLSLLGGMPLGARFGTLVHHVLEATDFAAGDLEADLRARVAAARARRPLEIGDPEELVSGLAAMLATPLGPLAGGARLCDVGRPDRLDELEFELPLAGGDRPSGRLTLDALGDVLRSHLPAGDPLTGYAERLADPVLRPRVRGYLTGSIDLVVRLPGPRFAVVDYKTNWLAAPGEPLTAWHHRPQVLATEMRHAHYGLQALLYTAALHRYLRWRMSGYDPERHLAGVLYLFVRGMVGPDTPVVDGSPCGVFAWRPSGALVGALSDALDGDGS